MLLSSCGEQTPAQRDIGQSSLITKCSSGRSPAQGTPDGGTINRPIDEDQPVLVESDVADVVEGLVVVRSGNDRPDRLERREGSEVAPAICGVRDYAELIRRAACASAIGWTGTPHNQSASRKSRRRSVAVKRSG